MNYIESERITVSAEWMRARETSQVVDLYNACLPTDSAGEVDDQWMLHDVEEYRQVMKSVCATATMVFRISGLEDDRNPRRIRGACAYRMEADPRLNATIIYWAVDPELSPRIQKIVAEVIFDTISDKIPPLNETTTLVSERDLWRQTVLRDFGFVCFGTVTEGRFCGYRFKR